MGRLIEWCVPRTAIEWPRLTNGTVDAAALAPSLRLAQLPSDGAGSSPAPVEGWWPLRL